MNNARKIEAAGKQLASLLSKVLQQFDMDRGRELVLRTGSSRPEPMSAELTTGDFVTAGVDGSTNKPHNSPTSCYILWYSPGKPRTGRSTYCDAFFEIQNGMYIPSGSWTDFRGTIQTDIEKRTRTAVIAAARKAFKPVAEAVLLGAARALTINQASKFIDRVVQNRRSGPQYNSNKKRAEVDNLIVQTLANVYPALAPRIRKLRNPFGTSSAPMRQGKLFAQQPRKANIKNMLAHWTTQSYKRVQAVRRANGAIPLASRGGKAVEIQKLDAALAMYMRQFALRAPDMPPKVRNVATGSGTPVLYRGVSLTTAQLADFLDGKFQDKGYMAFSRNPSYAMHFLKSRPAGNTDVRVVFKLSTTKVQRGTPWVWFASDVESTGSLPANYTNYNEYRPKYYKGPALPEELKPKRRRRTTDEPISVHKNYVRASSGTEFEVLLPPGRLVPLAKTPTTARLTIYNNNASALVYDVTYMPDRNAVALWNGKPLVR